MRGPVSFRLQKTTLEQLRFLQALLGVNKTQVVQVAIFELYHDALKRKAALEVGR